MSDPDTNSRKEALKQLRKDRSNIIEQVRKMNKLQNEDIKKINTQLETGGKTVPEIADKTGLPSSRVLLYLASLMEYGLVVEGEKSGDYFTYVSVQK